MNLIEFSTFSKHLTIGLHGAARIAYTSRAQCEYIQRLMFGHFFLVFPAEKSVAFSMLFRKCQIIYSFAAEVFRFLVSQRNFLILGVRERAGTFK